MAWLLTCSVRGNTKTLVTITVHVFYVYYANHIYNCIRFSVPNSTCLTFACTTPGQENLNYFSSHPPIFETYAHTLLTEENVFTFWLKLLKIFASTLSFQETSCSTHTGALKHTFGEPNNPKTRHTLYTINSAFRSIFKILEIWFASAFSLRFYVRGHCLGSQPVALPINFPNIDFAVLLNKQFTTDHLRFKLSEITKTTLLQLNKHLLSISKSKSVLNITLWLYIWKRWKRLKLADMALVVVALSARNYPLSRNTGTVGNSGVPCRQSEAFRYVGYNHGLLQ